MREKSIKRPRLTWSEQSLEAEKSPRQRRQKEWPESPLGYLIEGGRRRWDCVRLHAPKCMLDDFVHTVYLHFPKCVFREKVSVCL